MDTPNNLDRSLKHYGVMGMKWGIRKDPSKKLPQKIEVKTAPGKKVKASGGRNYRPSKDSVRVAKLRQQAKASSTDSLTNRQMQDVVTRMNLEQNYSRLNPESFSKQATKSILKEYGPVMLVSGVGALSALAIKKGIAQEGKLDKVNKYASQVAGALAFINKGSGKKKK